MPRVVAVTGGLGFIGRYVVEKLLSAGDYVCVIDSLTYAADSSLIRDECQQKTIIADICDLRTLPDVDVIINLAAETHVDNSLTDNEKFFHSNVLGVRNLLELCRAKRNYEIPLFIQISTDEVYGDIGLGKPSTERDLLVPSSPYAASKAAADMLVQAWGRSYDIPWRIVRPSNCYGAGQYHEKFIPKAIRYLGLGKPIPVHEGGKASRSWLAVEDCADAILTVLDKGSNGEIYNVPGNCELSVENVAKIIISAYHDDTVNMFDHIQLGYTRMGLDFRYCVDGSKLLALGWQPSGNFSSDIPKLVEVERKGFRW